MMIRRVTISPEHAVVPSERYDGPYARLKGPLLRRKQPVWRAGAVAKVGR